jgi:hypothetical protein
MFVWLRRRKLCGRRIQPVQRTDAAIGHCCNSALHAETKTNTSRSCTGRAHDRREKWEREQSSSMLRCRALRCCAHCESEPAAFFL